MLKDSYKAGSPMASLQLKVSLPPMFAWGLQLSLPGHIPGVRGRNDRNLPPEFTDWIVFFFFRYSVFLPLSVHDGVSGLSSGILFWENDFDYYSWIWILS